MLLTKMKVDSYSMFGIELLAENFFMIQSLGHKINDDSGLFGLRCLGVAPNDDR